MNIQYYTHLPVLFPGAGNSQGIPDDMIYSRCDDLIGFGNAVDPDY